MHDGQAGHQVDHRPLPSVVPPVHSGQPARPLLDDRAGRRPAGSGRLAPLVRQVRLPHRPGHKVRKPAARIREICVLSFAHKLSEIMIIFF